MSRVRKSLPAALVLFMLACNFVTQPLMTATPAPASATAASVAPAAETETPSPAPEASDTPAATQPSAPSPTLSDAQATMNAEMGPMADLMNIRQYFDPVGTPLKIWHNVPIMSQATAGQEFKATIYSYKATATLEQAFQFYSPKAKALGIIFQPGRGSSGSGDQASHNIDFISFTVSIVLTSFDNDTGHVIVVIAAK